MTNQLTRSKIVTRDIKEVMDYTYFGKDLVAVRVKVTVTGVDPFKSEHHAIISKAKFDASLRKIAKDKGDFSYTDHISKNDESHFWAYVPAADRKRFQKFPTHDMMHNYAYDFFMEYFRSLTSESEKCAHRKKVYTNAVNKDGSNLVHMTMDDHTFRDVTRTLIPVPLIIDHGLRSTEFLMKPIVDMLRKQSSVQMRQDSSYRHSDTPYKDYPEIKTIPYYNAEESGETEVVFWILLPQDMFELVRGDHYEMLSVWVLDKFDILPLNQFRLVKND